MTMEAATEKHDTLRQFVLWAIDELEFPLAEASGVYRLDVPEDDRAAFGHRQTIFFTFDPSNLSPEASDDVELASPESTLFRSLVGALRASDGAIAARPADQPTSVHELADRLFAAYTIEGGSVHLGGLTLADRPFLRLTCLGHIGQTELQDGLCEVFVDEEGQAVSEPLLRGLGLDHVVRFGDRPPRMPEAEIDRLRRAAESVVRSWAEAGGEIAGPHPLVATLVWCKYAEGKLCLTIGDRVEEVPLAGWARQLEAPPYVCPYTGATSFHVAATDDGRLTAANQIDTCAQSGRRVLKDELVECAVTGRRVLAEYAAVCPVTGDTLVRSALVTCSICRQQVSPGAVAGGVCQACRSMQPVSKADPRMARLLGEHPGLDRWRHWRLAETATVYLASARGVFRRLLVVIDKHSLQPVHLATGVRLLGGGWSPLPPLQYEETLR